MPLSGAACQLLGGGQAVRFSTVLVLVVCAVMGIQDAESADCSVSMNGGLPYPEPLILDPRVRSLDGFSFKRPQVARNQGTLSLNRGDSVRLVCTGPNNHFPGLGAAVRDITVTCVRGVNFTYQNTQRPFVTFRCADDSLATARNVASTSCSGNGRQAMAIGFEITRAAFVKIIDVCFDRVNLDVLWTRFDLLSEIGGQETGLVRPRVFQDYTFPFRADNFYLRITQRSTITRIIGKTMAELYIGLQGDSYLSRGHLVAASDFIYNVQKLATFNLINAAPQWYLFNEGNWNVAEMQTRNYATSKSVDLVVYTGTHGNEKLPDSSRRLHNVYLYVGRNGVKSIKAPAVYWKVVYEPVRRRAIALVGVNNQLKNWAASMATPGVDLCPGKHQTSRVWRICGASNTADQARGFGYCCEVKDIRSRVNFPQFTVTGLLV